jgi:hypothetical protein
VQCIKVPSEYYAHLAFEYDPQAMGGRPAALDEACFLTEGELSLFYYIACSERIKRREWQKVETVIGALSSLYEGSALKSRMHRILISAKRLDAAFMALLEYEIMETSIASAIDEEHASIYKTGVSMDCFLAEVDQAIENAFSAPSRQLTRLVQLFESRRRSRSDAFALMTSSLLGGATGALLTLWLSR